VAKAARMQLEQTTGKKVVTNKNAKALLDGQKKELDH
jgi:hypothetical protein